MTSNGPLDPALAGGSVTGGEPVLVRRTQEVDGPVCPECGAFGAVVDPEHWEVDIGVGTIRIPDNFVCRKCGVQAHVGKGCGSQAWEGREGTVVRPCSRWCPYGNTD